MYKKFSVLPKLEQVPPLSQCESEHGGIDRSVGGVGVGKVWVVVLILWTNAVIFRPR